MSSAMQDAIELRRKCPQFRILVLGRANAGKTTLLKKVCESIEDPEIYGPDNERRGIHDIELQLIFKSNPGFIFHDSRGFESGSVEEVAKVKHFITERAATGELPDQLHAIWYCLPTDTTRPLLKADEDFFAIDFQGRVPVIAIFTKLDGLAERAFTMLCDDGYDRDDALEHVDEKATELLETNFMAGLQQMAHPPSDYVQLEDMRQKTSNCKDLIEKTAESITDDGLRMLLVSVQRNNIALCIRYAVARHDLWWALSSLRSDCISEIPG
ncbi:era-like GTP-binding protein [Mycena alexandri]|uniref:Era-like GTP-binding protein n=1 Tax=Mycena alexandri TaxID=1745969 RepID=A0AAD6S0U7_9AGAR|nr:era-like GTP-binding protein [Mycena alexandri]